MTTPSGKKKWKIQKNGEGVPLSIFDIPDEGVEMQPKTNKSGISPWVTNGIASVVTVVWATSFLADILSKDYQPPTAIHVAFMAIVGAIFGFQIVKGKDNGNGS